jgi:hypothetical protein
LTQAFDSFSHLAFKHLIVLNVHITPAFSLGFPKIAFGNNVIVPLVIMRVMIWIVIDLVIRCATEWAGIVFDRPHGRSA